MPTELPVHPNGDVKQGKNETGLDQPELDEILWMQNGNATTRHPDLSCDSNVQSFSGVCAETPTEVKPQIAGPDLSGSIHPVQAIAATVQAWVQRQSPLAVAREVGLVA